MTKDAPRGRRVVAVVGIDAYESWQPLSNAVSDAIAARDAFVRLGFEAPLPPLTNGDATAAGFQRLVRVELKKLTKDDSLVLFFAGHGHTVITEFEDRSTYETGYIVPVNGEYPEPSASMASVGENWIRIDTWLQELAALPVKHLLVFLDACHAGIALGSAVKYRGENSVDESAFEELARLRSRNVISSAMANQRALDGGPVPGHSLFTGALLHGLDGDLARDGKPVLGSEIGPYLRRSVALHTKAQTPVYGAFNLDAGGELLLPIRSKAARREAEAKLRAEGAEKRRLDAQRRALKQYGDRVRAEFATQFARDDVAALDEVPVIAPPQPEVIATPQPEVVAPQPEVVAPPQPEVIAPRPEVMAQASDTMSIRQPNSAPIFVGVALLGVAGAGMVLWKAFEGEGTREQRMDSSIGASVAVDADDRVAVAVDAPSLRDRIEAKNPFVTIRGISLQAHQVTREQYRWYLESLPPDEWSANVPLTNLSVANGPDDARPATWLSHERAARFCRAIGASLPSSEVWVKVAGGAWGLDPSGSGTTGPLQEWTSTVTAGLAVVRGGHADMTEAERKQAVEEPLLKSTEEQAGPGAPADIVASGNIGFRCMR